MQRPAWKAVQLVTDCAEARKAGAVGNKKNTAMYYEGLLLLRTPMLPVDKIYVVDDSDNFIYDNQEVITENANLLIQDFVDLELESEEYKPNEVHYDDEGKRGTDIYMLS